MCWFGDSLVYSSRSGLIDFGVCINCAVIDARGFFFLKLLSWILALHHPSIAHSKVESEISAWDCKKPWKLELVDATCLLASMAIQTVQMSALCCLPEAHPSKPT